MRQIVVLQAHLCCKQNERLRKCVNDHLYGVYSVAEYFLQHRQVISVHGGNFSLFKLGGEPGRGHKGERFKGLTWLKSNWSWMCTMQERCWPSSAAGYLQGLWRADGLHLFLSFLIDIWLYQAVEDDTFNTPGERERSGGSRTDNK